MCLQGGMDFIDIKDLRIVEQGANEGPRRFERYDHRDAQQQRDRRFLDCKPLGGDFEDADTSGEEHADESEDGKQVIFRALEVVVDEIGDREEDRDDQDADCDVVEIGLQ